MRYDGDHKRQPALLADLEGRVRWVAVCPEVEAGLGVPREPIRLEGDGEAIRVRRVRTRTDLTDHMTGWVRARLASLPVLDGFVLKSRSPSCGLGDVPVYDEGGGVFEHGDGRFAASLRARYPELPIATERELDDAAGRRTFLERVEAAFEARREREA